MRIARRVLLALTLLAVAAPPTASAMVGGSVAPSAGSTVHLEVFGAHPGPCTGSLIGPSVVVTAAHCVDGATSITVTTGRADLGGGGAGMGQSLPAVRWTGSPQLAPPNHDIAFVDLGEAATAPVVQVQNFIPTAGYVLGARGYGALAYGGPPSTLLQEGALQVAACPANIPTDGFCTRATGAHPAVPCQGDSGGPALTADGLLIGVLSETSVGCSDYGLWTAVANETGFMAQARAPRITGRIAAGSGSPIAGARVRVTTAGGSVAATATTDAQGGYQVAVGQGTYTVAVSASGYTPGTAQGLTVSGPATASLRLVAAPKPKATVVGVVRRPDGRLAVRLTVTPVQGATARLRVVGLVLGTRNRDVGTTRVTVRKRGTSTVLLRAPTRAARAKAKVGATVRIGVLSGQDVVALKQTRIRRA